MKKGQIDESEEEEFCGEPTDEKNAVSSSDDEPDPYEFLEEAEGQPKDGFRFNPSSSEFYLKDFFAVPADIYDRLFEHQKDGVRWLYDQYKQKKGCVLGDDMGLGKTVQVAVLCKGLFDSEQIKKVLVVVPATLKVYWETELKKWSPGVDNIMQFDDKKKSDRE